MCDKSACIDIFNECFEKVCVCEKYFTLIFLLNILNKFVSKINHCSHFNEPSDLLCDQINVVV